MDPAATEPGKAKGLDLLHPAALDPRHLMDCNSYEAIEFHPLIVDISIPMDYRHSPRVKICHAT